MGIIKDFETDLGTDPEPLHRRLLRAGVRPTELAEALQEYLQDEQQVTDDGVLVPNVFRITLGTKDHERLARYGVALPRALGTVVVETAEERGWLLLGPVKVRVDRDELVKPGAFRLVGRTEPVEGWGPAPEALTRPAEAPTEADARPAMEVPSPSSATPTTEDVGGLTDPTLEVRTGVDAGARLALDGRRVTAGRGNGCDLIVRDTTISREHAAFVRRGDTWWVLDLGSTNGTRVNGLRAAEHPIAVGDRIELGDVVVELVEA
jgi:pSer/pThr/pTyr-binding forkhead associated (FHA) protein